MHEHKSTTNVRTHFFKELFLEKALSLQKTKFYQLLILVLNIKHSFEILSGFQA